MGAGSVIITLPWRLFIIWKIVSRAATSDKIGLCPSSLDLLSKP